MRTIIRVFGVFTIIILAICCKVNAGGTHLPDPAHSLRSADTAKAAFDSLWVEYDVTKDNARGMIIHISFDTYNMKDVSSLIAIFFEYNDDRGGRLKDKNQKFYSSGGDVAVYSSLKPQWESTNYKDLQVFMPYDEFDLKSGKFDITMVVNLILEDGTLVAKLDRHNFEFTNP